MSIQSVSCRCLIKMSDIYSPAKIKTKHEWDKTETADHDQYPAIRRRRKGGLTFTRTFIG